MEKGKLLITKTKKGDFIATIIRESDQKNIPVKTKFKDDKLNGQPVFFEAEKGDIIKIVNESNETIYEKPVKTINQPASQKVTKKLPDSFERTKTRLPKDTRELSIKADEVDNFLWKLNLAARYDDETEKKNPKFKFFHKGRKKEEISYEIHANFEKVNLQDILKRQEYHVNALCTQHKSQQFTPDWRLIIGLGQESVYETSITLHHIYGIPYIPASAIKGVTRNYYISECFDGVEKQAMKDEQFCQIFGADDNSYDGAARQGQVFFFDAFPTELNDNAIQPDVMNVHYPEYYGSGTKPPTDTQNPNPILFLTVENTPFQFIIGIKKAQENAETLLKTTTECLKNALEQHGIGAKTAVGYGFGSLDTV
ncbi:MAG: type III-B CRISPR module RAMP protein Cmr6 [Pseudomonadota bacterium]|nr:type III-B CRISPR module RAMP protein Cmr6 [Pseudomonadota bacterium]